MSELTSLQLYQWITEEMGCFPKKACGYSRSLLTPHDLDFLLGGNRCLWDHVMKHVHSVSKAQHVRKNILLSRLRKNKLMGIQKGDAVGDKIHLLGEVKRNQAKLKKTREEIQECEKLMKSGSSLLKMSGCQRHHLQNIADSTERRCTLLKMRGETIQALTDALNYASKCVTLGKAPESSTSNIQHHSSIGFEEESANDLSNVHENHPVLFECKRFLKKCVSVAKDLLDEKLEALNMERSSNNSIFEFSQLSIESRLIDFDTLRVHNAISETKKNEFKSFINYNRKAFPANHLFESLLSLISEKHRKMPAFYDDHYYTLQQKMYGMEYINELECMLSEKLTHTHASVTHDFTVAAQDKVVTSRMTNELKQLMLCMEKDLNEMFPDNAMKEKVYKLIEVMQLEVSVGATISYIKKSLNDILVETSDNSPVHQMKKLDAQLKTMEDEMVCLRKVLMHLQRMKKEIVTNVKNNYDEVRQCLFNVNLQNILSMLGDDELLVDLTRREQTIFNEYPLECHKKSLFLGREVLDSMLLMNGHMLGGAMCENDVWMKLTLGMAPYSSTEHILAVLFKAKGFLDTLSGPAMLFDRGLLQSGVAKIPEVLKSLEEDENKSEAAIMEVCNFIDEGRSKTVKEIEETNSIHNTWLEGKINKCVPECNLFDGKTFLQWYYEYHSLLHREELL